jgi:hypothetical protein
MRFTSSVETEDEVREPAVVRGLSLGGRKLAWPLEKLGEALGRPRLGGAHLERIAAWAISSEGLPLVDGASIIHAYLADPACFADHALFFRSALEVGGYVGKDADTDTVAAMCHEMHPGFMRTAPACVLLAIDAKLPPVIS